MNLYLVIPSLPNSYRNNDDSSKTAMVRSFLSLLIDKNIISANIPANKKGTSNVSIMNDFFFTLFRYSCLNMSSVLFIFLVFIRFLNCLYKYIVHARNFLFE